MSDKLLPCPFCGDIPELWTDYNVWIIDCHNDGLRMFDLEKRRLVELWNTRIEPLRFTPADLNGKGTEEKV